MDDLDHILAQARWPEPSPQSDDRLRESWRALSAQAAHRRVIGWMSLAASVLLALGVVGWLAYPRPKSPEIAVNPTVLPAPIAVTNRHIVAREPTALERFALMQVSPRMKSEPDPSAIVEQTVKSLVADPASLEPSVKAIRALNNPQFAEQYLMAQAQRGDTKTRFAAMRLFAEVGGSSALPILLQEANTKLAPAAMPGICRLASTDTVAQLVPQQHDAALRQQLLTALISRRDKSALGQYLAFVLNPSFREDALAALRAMPNPPVDALLAEFDHAQVSYRLAAASAVGRICHGHVTPLLLRMVDRDDHRREALAALTFCSDPAARKFLDSATPSIRSELEAVRIELASQL